MGHATVQILTYGTYIENRLARETQIYSKWRICIWPLKIGVWLSAHYVLASKKARLWRKRLCLRPKRTEK